MTVRIHTIFDQKLNEVARPFISQLIDCAAQTKKPAPKSTRLNHPSSDEVLDMMLLQKEFNPVPPTPIKAAPPKPTNQPSQHISFQDQSRLMEEDIDRMVAELESREYDGSKYQDVEQTGYKTFFKENASSTLKSPLLPQVQISQYHLSNPSKVLSSNLPQSHISQTSTPLMYAKPNQAIVPAPTKTFQKKSEAVNFSSKSLKIDIYELSFSGMPFNEQQLISLCAAKLQMSLPNGQQATFTGKRSGETVSYSFRGYEVEVNERVDSTGQTKLFVSSEIITFTVVEDYSGKELAYGTLDLDRLLKADGRGVFVVSLNNRNIKNDSVVKPQTLTLSATEASRLKPTTVCLYSLRIGLELLSHAKGKVYQLFLEINKIDQVDTAEQELKLRYKLYGTQENIELDARLGASLDHSSVMPVLLESMIAEKQPKLIVEVWNSNFQSLIGLVELELTQIPMVLLLANGRLDESVVSANVYPIFLYKGSQPIKQLITKKTVGSIDLSMAFGSVKQVNRVMAERQQKPVLIPSVVRQQQKVVLPYDQKLGLFVKEKKKEVREIDVQVDFTPQKKSEPPSIIEESPIQHEPDESIASEESLHILNIQPSIAMRTVAADPPKADLQETVRPLPPPSLTPEFIASAQHLIEKVLGVNPNFLTDLKQAVGKYLLFSFIEKHVLLECMLSATRIDEDTAQKLIKLVPKTIDSTMLSITPLYDYFASFSVNRSINEKLVSDELLGQYLLERYAERAETANAKHYIADKDEVKDIMLLLGYHLSLREVEVLWKHYSTVHKINYVGQWQQTIEQLKERARKKQLKLILSERQTDNLLNAIYEPYNQSQLSEPKRNCLNVSVKGLQSCVQSAKCLLNIASIGSYARVRIFGQVFTFYEDTAKEITMPEDFTREQFACETGSVELCSESSMISQCSMSLQRMVLEDIDGTYALKTKEGSFCGLIRLTLQYIE